MKKVLSIVICAVLCLSMVTIVSAEKITFKTIRFESPAGHTYSHIEYEGYNEGCEVMIYTKNAEQGYFYVEAAPKTENVTVKNSCIGLRDLMYAKYELEATYEKRYGEKPKSLEFVQKAADYSEERDEYHILATYKVGLSDGTQVLLFDETYIIKNKGYLYIIRNQGLCEEGYNNVLYDVMDSVEMLDVQIEEPQEETIKILVNGERVIPDSDPVIVNDRTLCPIRAVAEKLGYRVEWIGEYRTVMITDGEGGWNKEKGSLDVKNYSVLLMIVIDQSEIEKYTAEKEEKIKIDVPAQIINDRTYLPLRAVGEALDCFVDWDGETRTVIVESTTDVVTETTSEDDIIVYVGETGTKYHYKDCRTLANGAYPISLENAKEQGYTACKICY